MAGIENIAQYDRTAERLQAYFPFPDEIIDAVATVASDQSGLTYQEFLAAHEISPPIMYDVRGAKPISVLTIDSANADTIPGLARVRFLGQGNGLMRDGNQVYQVATAHVTADAAGDGAITYAFGNPGGLRQGEAKLSVHDQRKVARGDSRPLIDAPMRFLASKKVKAVEIDGYSAGVLQATTAAEHADKYDIEVRSVTNIEAPNVKPRGLKLLAMATLGIDFARTAGPLKGYLEVNELPGFVEARDDSALRMANYMVGLFRPTNLARSAAMADDSHGERTSRVLDTQADAKVHDIWGSESELAKDALMTQLTGALQYIFGDRYGSTRLQGQKHTMVNDLALQSALLLHARRVMG